MDKLKDNEFYALKLVDNSGYYGDRTYSLRGVKLYKNYNTAISMQNTFSKPTRIVIISLNERELQ